VVTGEERKEEESAVATGAGTQDKDEEKENALSTGVGIEDKKKEDKANDVVATGAAEWEEEKEDSAVAKGVGRKKEETEDLVKGVDDVGLALHVVSVTTEEVVRAEV